MASSSAPTPSEAPPKGGLAPLFSPDPGPGLISCGTEVCKAGLEVCAPKESCAEDWPARGCVPVAELKARTYDEKDPSGPCDGGCHSWFDQKACDGPGDCAPDEVCCYDADLIIGPCDDGDNGMLDVFECKKKVDRFSPCGTEEMCSAKDSACSRRGSACEVNPTNGVGTCNVPRRGFPMCGTAPCGRGQVCIETPEGTRRCVDDPSKHGDARVIACDRGLDCAPDEACFSFNGGHRCDLSALSWAGNDIPICKEAIDCVGYCHGEDEAVCHPDHGCECRPQCRQDSDCVKEDYCISVSLNRYGGAVVPLERFCDRAKRRCDCREPSN